jgi:Icc protein
MAREFFRIVQITDLHLVAEPGGRVRDVDTHGTLQRVIARIGLEEPGPGMVLITGDISEDGSAESYHRARQLFDQMQIPYRCIPGNHDSRDALSSVIPLSVPRTGRSLFAGGWQIVLLDSTVAGSDDGRFERETLAALEITLRNFRDTPALICLHHHPVVVGGAWGEAVGLENANQFFEVVDARSNVGGVIWGHIHQEFAAKRRHMQLMGSPSTCFQFAPGEDGSLATAPDPPAYRRIDLYADGTIESEVRWLSDDLEAEVEVEAEL